MARHKMMLNEAWRILWSAKPLLDKRVLDPIAVLAKYKCGRDSAIELIYKLSEKRALIPRCTGRSRKNIISVDMLKEPPPEEEKESSEITPEASNPALDMLAKSEVTVADRYQTSPSHVIILMDRDNIMISLRKLRLPFPFENVFRFAADHGGLEAAFFFCPIGAQEDEMLLFRRHGFQIVLAPSVKHEGGDRVDKSLEDVGKLLLKNPDVGTLMILSEDRDFSDLFVFAKGNGKKVYQFRVHERGRVLRSTEYLDEIPIPAGPEGLRALTDRPITARQAAASS